MDIPILAPKSFVHQGDTVKTHQTINNIGEVIYITSDFPQQPSWEKF